MLKPRVFHPGYYIREMIEEAGIDEKEFASELNITIDMLNNLLRGKESISKDLAEKLSEVSGTSAELWLNLQKKYDETYKII